MIRRRPTQIFSLAFLDCICCGFGAIILLFVLTVDSKDKARQETIESLRRLMAAHLAAVAQIDSVKQDLQQRATDISKVVLQARIKEDQIQALLDKLEKQLQHEKTGQGALLVDVDELKKEIAARQKKAEMVLRDVKPTPVGLPVGSNFVVFVIDTSGSMRDPGTAELWPVVLRKIDEALDAYPQLEGLQILDADGRFLLGRGAEQWLPDSPQVRSGIKQAIRRYDIFSNSNPVPGIFRALRTLHDPKNEKMKMCVFIFGDEFTGTADAVIKALDQLNPADEKGQRKVVINAVGFPTTIQFTFAMGNTGLKFANLMREITYQHGGAFIALQDL